MFSTWVARSKLKSKELESIRVSGLDKFPPCLARSADQSDDRGSARSVGEGVWGAWCFSAFRV